MADLKKNELLTVIQYGFEQLEAAQQDGSCSQLRSTVDHLSDIFNPKSFLGVDTEAGTVEVTGWEEDEEDDAESEDDDGEDFDEDDDEEE
jgi:hypothetical protein